MLQAKGHDYAELERDGIFLVVHKISCRYMRPARFGDTLRIVTTATRATQARIEHEYQVVRTGDEQILAEGNSTIACIDGEGKIRRMPEFLVEAHWGDTVEVHTSAALQLKVRVSQFSRHALASGYSSITVANAKTANPKIKLKRSEEHTSELQSHWYISYAVFCLKKKKHKKNIKI